MAGDPFWDQVVFRSTLDTLPPVDVSLQALPLVASTSGPALTSGVFGNALSYGAGTGAYRAATSGDVGRFGSGDFTVEGWFKQLYRTASGAATFGMWPGGSRSWAIVVQEDTLATSSQIRLFASSNGTAFDIINAQSGVFTGIALDQWYHFCLERSGNTARFYIDGVMRWKRTISGSLFDASDKPLRLFDDGQTTHFKNAAVAFDDLRITKGVARYARDTGFPVPTEPYPVAGDAPPSTSVAPLPGSLTVTGEIPTVVAGIELSPWSGDLSVLGVSPQLVLFNGVRPQPGALQVSGAVPDLAFDLDLDALPGVLTLTGRAPGVFIGVTVAPRSGGLTVSGGTPGVFTISGAVSSQAAMLGLVQPPAPPSSASQLAAMALAEPPPPPTRASQAAMMAIGEIVPVVAASQAAILALGQGSSCISYRCQLWTIRRRDGVVFRYTSHDQPVHRGPFVYSPCRSLDPTASENSSTLGSVGNIELTGIIDDEGISEADLYGGLFDDAYVTVDLYSWGDQAEAPRRLAAGWTGQVSQGDTSFQMEVLGPAARLDQQALVQMVTPGCRWIFGDSRCGVDVEAMRLSGTVVAARTRGHLFVDVPAPPPGRQWANGRIRFTSGRNAGQIVETKSVDFGAGEVVTWVSPGFLAEPGDAIELLPGCDLSRDGGCTLYQNVINFGGFPDVPGSDALLESPDAKY